ncbi:MAG: ABC transporter permease [Bryobacteraceae bacterium]
MPDWKTIVRDRIAELRLTGSVESDLVEELAQHLQDRYRELRSGGLSEEKALETALSELGSLDLLRVQSARTQVLPTRDLVTPGDSRRGRLVAGLWGDFRYAARTMRKNPAFVVFVVLTLALGIGANTTVFTVINTLILNPLPVPHPSQLVAITSTKVKEISKSSAPVPLSYADLNDLRARNSVFRSFAGYSTPHPMTWQSNNTSQGMFAELVTGNYFSVLELKPFAGRFFLPEEDTAAGQSAVAVMNYGTWRSRFGGSADILGKTLRLNNVVITVIGVAPPDFIGMNAIFGPDLWIPSRMTEQLFPNEMRAALTDRSKALFLGVARLRPPMTRAQAQANIATLAADLAGEYPETDENRTVAVRPIGDVLFGSNSASSTPILFGGIGLLAVVGIVLLIACSNVANLLMARAAARKQEMAVRLALGANRRRLVRQLLTESVLLGSLGGAAGLFVAYAGLHLLFAALPSSSNFIAPKFDTAVFVFALIVSLTTGFLFGAIPALRASDVPVAETLKEEVRTMGRSRHKVSFANALLVGQVAFSFLLLLTASLFLRSIARAYTLDPGFQTAHLAVFMTSPGQAGYSKARTKAFYKDVSERVEQISGIQSVSWASNLPLWANPSTVVEVEGRQARSQADRTAIIVDTVDLNYFETAGIRMLNGREFSSLDQENSVPVVIVNEKMARDDWPGQNALGKRIRLSGEKQFRQIVGIARTAYYSNWGEPPQQCAYVPFKQKYSDGMVLYVRTKGGPAGLVPSIQSELRTAGPQVKFSTQTGQQIINGGLFFAKVGVTLLSIFGLLALGLASIGLYGILAYGVGQRKREIGLRMALGANRRDVLRLILQEGMSLVVAGVLIGFVANLTVGRLLSRLLYGVSAADPLSVAGAAAVLLFIALCACYLPARGASNLDPLLALHEG